MSVKVVTGFVPIQNHPRKPEDYLEQGDQLFGELYQQKAMSTPATAMLEHVDTCWLFQYLTSQGAGYKFKHSEGDNPKKNTVAYHITQHQKTHWMMTAMAHDQGQHDVYVWIDMGISHVPGVTATVIADYLRKVENEKVIAIPGCVPSPDAVDDANPCWRFCGGLIACPAKYLVKFDAAVKLEAIEHLERTGNLSWEVNTWARLEKKNQLPLWWYQADHNETMFSAYGAAAHA